MAGRWLALGLAAGMVLAGCARGLIEPPARATLTDEALPQVEWRQIEEAARGSEVSWYTFGNSEAANRYVDEYVTPQVYARYGITLRRVPVNDTGAVLQDLVSQRQSRGTRPGRADLLWISGADYHRAREGGALFGSWSGRLPNARYVDWSQPAVASDLGLAASGYEAPWGQTVLLLLYDANRVPNPPRTIPALEAWAQAHPGRFTYPQPPSPEGSAFLAQVLYELTGGYASWQGALDDDAYRARVPAVWEYLGRLRPALWHGGQEYPASARELQALFLAGEVDLCLSYSPSRTWQELASGALPPTTRAYRFTLGTLASAHYVAIPFNAPHKAAAMVVANFLESPEAQAEKASPVVWGDLPVINPRLLGPPEAPTAQAVGGQAGLAGPTRWAAPWEALLWAPRLPRPPVELAARLEQEWAGYCGPP